jgi:CDP-diglyceride synthetase
MMLPGALGAANRGHVFEALYWLFYVATLGALPFWGIVFVVWLGAGALDRRLFVEHAELAIYSAGLLAAGIPIMQREIKDSPFRQPKIFLALAIMIVVIDALLFGYISSHEPSSPQPATALTIERALWASVALVTTSVVICFLTELINNVRIDPDLRAMQTRRLDSLSSQLGERLKEQQ